MRRDGVLVIVIAAVVMHLLTAVASATFPGANGKLAITSSEPCGTCLVGVYTINPDGTGRTRVSPVTVGDLEPKWSPNGSRIAFSRGPYHDVWAMNADGGGAVNLTAGSTANDFSPAWSPAGDKIAFASCCADGGFAIYVMNADGSGRHRLTAPLPDAFDLDWSPRGDQIAFVGGSVGYHVYVADALTGEVTQVTHGYNSYSPSWSPDGLKIVLAEDRESPDEPGNPCFCDDIAVMNPDGSGLTRLMGTFTQETHPAWSPDGTRIMFTDNNQDLFTIGPDGSDQTRVTTSPPDYYDADWQPIPGPQRSDYKNAATFCKADREFLGEEGFRQKYRGGANAYGMCVSSKR